MIECPICKGKTHVELDTHSDGYAENLQECGDCGALWITDRDHHNIMVHGATQSYVDAP